MDDGSNLYYAVVENNVPRLVELLEHGANVDEFYEDTMNISSKSLLHICCGKGHVECLKVLIQYGAQLDVRDKWGQTPLMYSVSIQFPEVTKVLLDADAELVKCQDRYGKAPLHCAVEAESEELVRLLIEYGADINIRCHDGMTPLMLCSNAEPDSNRTELVKMLLDLGAELDIKDYRGKRTALHIAAVVGNYRVVETLIAAGADVNQIDKTLRTPLTLAIYSGVKGPEVKKNIMRVITLLVSAGAKLDVDLSESCNPLMSCALLRSDTMVRYFLSLGANPNLYFPSGVTPALAAASTGDLLTLKPLIYYNSDLTIKGKVYKRIRRVEYHLDPFELAYLEGFLQLCVLMVEAGYRFHGKLDIFLKDSKSPLRPNFTYYTSGPCDDTLTLTMASKLPEDYLTTLEWMIERARCPRSLREEAVFAIRKCLGIRLVNAVDSLPLPQSVKKSILLTHIVGEITY